MAAACSSYEECTRAGLDALNSQNWQPALASFQAASVQHPKSGNPWVYIGRIFLATGQYNRSSAAWDKALSLSEPLTVGLCYQRGRLARDCEEGNLLLTPKAISFVKSGGEMIFSADTHDVKVNKVLNNGYVSLLYLEVGGKIFTLRFAQMGPSGGVDQETAVTRYISVTIPKLASGQFGSSSSK
jgi:tetratricopeptide (TPR) repeat protein